MAINNSTINTIIFDLGNVLIGWEPKNVFSDTYFESLEQRDYFLQNICSPSWNEEQDGGRSIVDATFERIALYPDWEQPIRDFYGRWTDMLSGPIVETFSILKQLKESGQYRLYALTNWQAELFHIARVRYDFLEWFDGRVVSGEEKTRKPFHDFYNILLQRYHVQPGEALFIDDSLRNVIAAQEIGITSIHFTTPQALHKRLVEMEIL